MVASSTLNRYLLWSVAVIALGLGVFSTIRSWSSPRIAFVRTSELVYKYAGMEEAQKRYKAKQATWQGEIDSLETSFRLRLDSLKVNAASLGGEQLEARRRDLALQRRSLEERRGDLEAKASKEDMELTQGVLNQINSFVENYGKEHGYDIIVGTSTTGNVLYGADGLDITKDVLNQLNKLHAPKAN